jgi:hypothetical protein
MHPICLNAHALLQEVRKLEVRYQEVYEIAMLSQSQKDLETVERIKRAFLLKEREARERLKKEYICFDETQKLSTFFERKVAVPPMPKEFTLEQLERWEKLGMEVHYFPAEEMRQRKRLKHWKYQLDEGLDQLERLLPHEYSVMNILKGWIVIDGRQKPPLLEVGEMIYENDPFPGSRFDIDPDVFDTPEMKQKMAQAFDLSIDHVQLPELIIWNLMLNIHHPEWGDTDTPEWVWETLSRHGYARVICEFYYRTNRFRVGSQDSCMSDIGFRAMARYPS